MTGDLFRSRRKDSFVYPVPPPPRTAILVSWFNESWFLESWFHDSFKSNRPLRVFPHGWTEDAAAFRPAAVAGTFEQLRALSAADAASLTHAVIVLWRAAQLRLSDEDREQLWAAFRVPIFEQVIGKSGKLLAAECEAHDGLQLSRHFRRPGTSLPPIP